MRETYGVHCISSLLCELVIDVSDMEGFDLVDTGTHRRGKNGEMEQLPEN